MDQRHEVGHIACAALVLAPEEWVVIFMLEEVWLHHQQARSDAARDDGVVSAVVAIGHLLGVDTYRGDERDIAVWMAAEDEVQAIEDEL